ncbi:hypothetical protein EV199_3068 [Pseudobacter ginsenosidimutans]|uniref:Uncharacterized protein n=1 Tax=Pseudobacter ginsenosidimutans TaxID=661488 RepID=A0A4Q7MRE9_9BACT|nr:hypothetical protein EV199_3068 [Pseudobacter ginsenosidimutans]
MIPGKKSNSHYLVILNETKDILHSNAFDFGSKPTQNGNRLDEVIAVPVYVYSRLLDPN